MPMAQSGSGMLPPKRKIVVIVSVSVPVNPSKAGQVSDQRRPRIPGIRFLLSDSAEKIFRSIVCRNFCFSVTNMSDFFPGLPRILQIQFCHPLQSYSFLESFSPQVSLLFPRFFCLTDVEARIYFSEFFFNYGYFLTPIPRPRIELTAELTF